MKSVPRHKGYSVRKGDVLLTPGGWANVLAADKKFCRVTLQCAEPVTGRVKCRLARYEALNGVTLRIVRNEAYKGYYRALGVVDLG